MLNLSTQSEFVIAEHEPSRPAVTAGMNAAQFRPLPLAQSTADVLRQRRRMRFLRFLVLEAIAVVIAIASVAAGISQRFADEAYTPAFRVLPICAAAAAAILPILFFGSPSRRQRRKRLIASGSPLHSQLRAR